MSIERTFGGIFLIIKRIEKTATLLFGIFGWASFVNMEDKTDTRKGDINTQPGKGGSKSIK